MWLYATDHTSVTSNYIFIKFFVSIFLLLNLVVSIPIHITLRCCCLWALAQPHRAAHLVIVFDAALLFAVASNYIFIEFFVFIFLLLSLVVIIPIIPICITLRRCCPHNHIALAASLPAIVFDAALLVAVARRVPWSRLPRRHSPRAFLSGEVALRDGPVVRRVELHLPQDHPLQVHLVPRRRDVFLVIC